MPNATIEEIHKVELDLLEKFVQLCDVLRLRYTLSSGTLLGAVRHGGFIPWDDDIDVSMVRSDYEILIEKANDLLPDGYFLEHYTTEKDCPNVFAKLVNCNTAWVPYEYKHLDIKHGIGMDIFPIDRVENPEKLKAIERKTARLTMMRNLCSVDYIKTIKNKGKKFIAYMLCPIAKMFGRRKLNIKQDTFNKGKNTGEWTTADLLKRHKLMPYAMFTEYEDIVFEGKTFRCIKNQEEYLQTVYGNDYMQIPPENKRVTHLAEIADCEKSYTEYEINKRSK